MDAWENLTPLVPTAGALIISAVLLFLLRIPQASRTVSESYDRLILRLNESNASLRAEMIDVREQLEVEREAREASEINCKRMLADQATMIERLRREVENHKNRR